MTLYKLTSPDGSPVHGGSGSWALPTDDGPGEWRSVKGKIVPCENGLHLLTVADIPHWLREGVLWEAEAKGRVVRHGGDKSVVRTARLVRQVAVLDRRLLVTFAVDCAEHVLPIFEKRRPNDDRPHKAIEAARGWLAGTVDIEEVRKAADAAAASAYAASAYAAAAASASASAAYAAADAASAAAARQGECTWQAQHLADLLGIPWEAAWALGIEAPASSEEDR